MATYNSIKEASDAYFAAKANNDAAGMKAANDAANAIRASQGQKAQYATVDIANTAAKAAAASGGSGSSANKTTSAGTSGGSPGVSVETRADGSSKVVQSGQGLGYYGNDPTLTNYYNSMADLYNNDKPTYNTTVYDRSSNSKSMAPNMSRDTSLAGKVVAKGNYAVYYDANGYATKAVKIGQGTSVQDLNNSGYYTGAQRTWADLTGNDVTQVNGRSDSSIFDGYAPVGAAATNKAPGTNANAEWLAAQQSGTSAGGTGAGGNGNLRVTLPNGQTTYASYVNGKVTGNFPVGSIVHTAGGDYQITGGTSGNYTSTPYTGGTIGTGGVGATGGATLPGTTQIGYGANVDYSDLINEAISRGASWEEVQSLLDQRNAKIGSDPSLSQYLYDENYTRAMQYIYTKQQSEAQLAANLAALQGAYDQNVASYNAARNQIGPTYQAQRNLTQGTSDVNWNQFNEIAAANGLNTGAVGQVALSRAVALQNDMNELNRSEAEELSAIDLEIAKLTAEYNSAIAQARAQGDADLAAALYEQFNNYLAQKQEQRSNAAALQAAQQEAEQARQDEAYSLVLDLITSGIMPTDTQLAAAGMSKADAQYLYAQIVSGQLSGGSTGGSGGTKKTNNNTPAGDGDGGGDGDENETVLARVLAGYYTPATDLNTGLNAIASANAGGDSGSYAAVSRELLNMRRSGSTDKTMADYLERQIDNGTVTEEQAYQLVATYGINLNSQNSTAKTKDNSAFWSEYLASVRAKNDTSKLPQPIYTTRK